MHFNPSTTIQTFLVPNQKILFTCIMKVMRYQKREDTVNPTDVFEFIWIYVRNMKLFQFMKVDFEKL